MSHPTYLTVVETGPPGFRRWRIQDARRRVWTGSGWSANETDGLLYGSNQQACFDCQRLLMTEHADARVRRFRAPVFVDVFCDETFTAEQLRHWLVRAARLHIDYAGGGFGPLAGSLGLLQIEWGQLEEETT